MYGPPPNTSQPGVPPAPCPPTFPSGPAINDQPPAPYQYPGLPPSPSPPNDIPPQQPPANKNNGLTDFEARLNDLKKM